MVCSSFNRDYLWQEMNHTFVSLIPKVSCLVTIAYFRPISLCNIAYKRWILFLVMLIGMLKWCMSSVIPSTFIQNLSLMLSRTHFTELYSLLDSPCEISYSRILPVFTEAKHQLELLVPHFQKGNVFLLHHSLKIVISTAH